MIILTIPYRNNNSIVEHREPDFQFIEYRLDYASDLSAIDHSGFNAQNIITIRDTAEGGCESIPDKTKRTVLKQVLHLTGSLIDCEYIFLRRNQDFSLPPERLILSLHTDWEKTELIKEFLSSEIKAHYYKLAVSCENLIRFNDLVSLIPQDKIDMMIMVPTYPSSVSSRLVYKLFNSQASYVYLDEPVTKNQASLSLANLCRINHINYQTEFYGIIGGEQVLNSLSLIVYNAWFRENSLNRVLLPIIEENENNAIQTINWLKEKATIKGFAITMPFKRKLAKKLKSDKPIINSWMPTQNQFANTDENAMKKAISSFDLNTGISVLIIGTGSTAETALNVLEQMRIKDITILNRHRIEQWQDYAAHDNTSSMLSYDLLINCTPFGLSESDRPDLLSGFKNLIDLPYGKRATALVSKAKSDAIPYVDGLTFWRWQAEAQADFFGLESGFKDYIKSLDLQQLLQ